MNYGNYRRGFWAGVLCVLALAQSSLIANAELVAHFKLDEVSGVTAVDSGVSSPQLNGTLTGSIDGNGVFDTPDWVTGIDGGAAQFGDSSDNTNNKLDDVIEVANSGVGSKFDINSALTISAWINLDDDSENGRSSTRHIAGRDRAGGGTGDGYGLNHTMSGGADLLRFMIADNDVDTTISSTTTLTSLKANSVAAGAGGWVHVAGVYDPGASMKLYINGLLDTELTTAVPVEAESVTTLFSIGRLEDSSNHSFYGLIDDVQLHNAALTNAEVLTAAGLTIAVPTLRINRTTGAMTLENAAFASDSLKMQGYSLSSASGALVQAGWKTITDHYDDSAGPGDGSVDADDEWTILTDGESLFDLSEFQFGGTPGDGGAIAAGNSVVLSQGAGPWLASDIENDLVMTVETPSGELINVPIVFEGNGDEQFLRSDLNTDGSLSGADWLIFSGNFPSTLADLDTLTETQAYRLGDVTRDGEIDIADFQAFKADYIAENGGGSFEAMLQSVPEPSSLLLMAFGSLAMAPLRRR